MTKYHELNVSSTQNKKRVGRGISAGQGKTAGRGTKGQGARTGKKLRSTFQGGQRPLVQGVPKARGFKSLRSKAQVVYLDTLNSLKGSLADYNELFEQGYIASPYQSVKVIARGELTKKVDIKLTAASASVVAAVTKLGGSFEKTPVPLKKSTSTKTTK